MAAFEVLPLDALSDNFMYLIACPATKCAAVVDPVEPEKLGPRAEHHCCAHDAPPL